MNATHRLPLGEEQDGERPAAYEPRLGDTVEDTERNKCGKVAGCVGPYIQLRPIGGGIEWDARPERLQPVPAGTALSEGVSVANARSRGECP